MISQLPEQGTQVGVVVFSRTAELRIRLNEYHDRDMLLDAVQKLTYPGADTHTSAGLHVARTQLFYKYYGDRVNASNVAVLITDGVSTMDTGNIIPHAEDLHRDGIRVICVGIGDKISIAEIRAISSPPHEKDVDYLLRNTFDFPESFISILVESIEQRQVETTTASKTYSGENKGEYRWSYVNYFVEPQFQVDNYLKHMTYVNQYSFHPCNDTTILLPLLLIMLHSTPDTILPGLTAQSL